MLRKTSLLFLSLLLCLFTALSSFAAGPMAQEHQTFDAVSGEIMPLDLDLMSGTITDATQFSSGTLRLNRSNGKYLNFYIRNDGDVSIQMTINDGNARVLAPGESGHIYVEITGALTKSYTCKAVPTPNGGEISFYYSIAQRDSQ